MLTVIDTIFDYITHFFIWAIDVINSLLGNERKTEFTADFMRQSELFTGSKKDSGFCINGKVLDQETSFKGVLTLGQTGSGKSTCVLIPSCFSLIGRGSLCINDPSGEIAEKVSGAFHQAGYDVQFVNYVKPVLGGYNPLKRIRSKGDIGKVSELIIFTALGRGKDPFWNISATNCLSIFIEAACSLSEEYRTMFSVAHLLNVYTYEPEKIDAIIVAANNPLLLSEYKAFNAMDRKTSSSVIATVKAAIKIFTDPDVALSTAYDTIDLTAFRTRPTILFFNNSVTSMKYFGLITSVFFEQFFAEILGRIPDKSELPVYFLIDEASSLYLNSLQIVLSNIRKTRAAVLTVFQAASQIASLYGPADAKSIRSNSFTTCFLPGQPLDVATEVSSTLGVFDFEDDKGIKRTRPLLTANEVRELDQCLILSGNRPGVLSKMQPYYANRRMRKLSEIPPYYPANKLPFSSPPIPTLDA